jgi:hypothetical protein
MIHNDAFGHNFEDEVSQDKVQYHQINNTHQPDESKNIRVINLNNRLCFIPSIHSGTYRRHKSMRQDGFLRQIRITIEQIFERGTFTQISYSDEVSAGIPIPLMMGLPSDTSCLVSIML